MINLKKVIVDIGVVEDLIQIHSDTHLSVQGSPLFGIKIHFERVDSTKLAYYFSIRTTSWTYDGERSDLHDIIGVCFAVFLKSSDSMFFNLAIINEEHPFCNDEIYGRYILPDKNNLIKDNDIVLIEKIIFITDLFGRFFGFVLGVNDDNIPERCTCDAICADIFRTFKQDNIDAKIRNFPKWEYYRDIENNISVLNAPEIISFLRTNLDSFEEYRVLNGVNSKLYIYNNSGYCVSHEFSHIIGQYIANISEEIVGYFFLENMIVVFCKNMIINISTPCGEHVYRTEKDLLRRRHISEYNILFKPKSIIWTEIIDPVLFEDLICDLLRKNENITSVRKVSHTNERDGGRDIIAEWLIPKSKIKAEDHVYESKRILVQCKAYKNGVGKKDVTDIRDTVENYDSDGYFLAVSTYTKSTLTDHLDKIKRDSKIWIDWWTQSEINEEILKYPDIILKYRSMFTVSDLIY